MKKRKLQLDKEVLTGISGSINDFDAGATPMIIPIVESISLVLTVASALEPGFCDCLDTDSCQPVSQNYSECTTCTHNKLC